MTAAHAINILYVHDLPCARAFFAERLGMEVVPRFSSDTFIFLKSAGGTPIALQPITDLPPGAHAVPGGVPLSFDVADVEATYADWKAAGVAVLSEVADNGAGRVFYALDPEGNLLGVAQLHEPVRAHRQALGI